MKNLSYFCAFQKGRMAEWSIAAVLKTVELRGSGGSNPSPSAKDRCSNECRSFFICVGETGCNKPIFLVVGWERVVCGLAFVAERRRTRKTEAEN